MRTIIVESYNPAWPEEFNRIKAYLLPYIGDIIIDIAHVGSTSVPGLAAKPIIDFIIIIDSYDVFPEVAQRLRKIGYEHEGDLGIPMRECFKRSHPDDFMDYHMYVCPKYSPEMKRQILFRDYLRTHEKARNEYANLKQALSEVYRHDINAYTNGKHDFIENVLKKAELEQGLL